MFIWIIQDNRECHGSLTIKDTRCVIDPDRGKNNIRIASYNVNLVFSQPDDDAMEIKCLGNHLF